MGSLDRTEHIHRIDEAVHNDSEKYTCRNIKYGMLLDKHGRKDYRSAEDETSHTHSRILTCLRAVGECEVDPERIVNMDTRPEIGRCIGAVEIGDHSREDIASGCIDICDIGAEVMTVRPDRGDHKEYRHTRSKQYKHLVEFILIENAYDDDINDDIPEPEEIRYNKHRDKRDLIVKYGMDDRIRTGDRLLKICEPQHIDSGIDYRRNAVFGPLIKVYQFLFHSHTTISIQ